MFTRNSLFAQDAGKRTAHVTKKKFKSRFSEEDEVSELASAESKN